MKVLLLILAQILGDIPMNYVEGKEMAFKNLPIVCLNEYDQDLLVERNATSTEVIYIDLDGDGQDEILSFEGNAGSGGYLWNVITLNQKVGEVFGYIVIVKNNSTHGLLVGHAIGFDETLWCYYELKNFALKELFVIKAKYYPPTTNTLRTKVKSLDIKSCTINY